MKKVILKALVVIGVVAGLLAGCAKDNTGDQIPRESQPGVNGQAGDGKGMSKEAYNVVILLNGNLGDKAFYDSAANGGKMIEKELGDKVKVVEMGYDETKWLPTLIDFSEDKDTDIIIVGTWQMAEKLQETAPQYPDKKYVIYDSTVDYSTGDCANVYSIEYKQNECSFLAGATAALTTKTGTIGFVGGMENFVINDFLVGYIQGAKYINKEIRIPIGYVGNFNDSAKAKELCLAQINQNADIIFQAASTAGLGVIDGATEKDKLAIGADSDQAEAFADTDKDKADHILTSALKRVDQSVFRAVSMAHDGTLPWGSKEVLGLKEGAVGIAENSFYDELVSEENRKKIEELKKSVISGEITVDTAFNKTTEEIQEIRNSVRP